jgi:chaperonin GroEL
VRAAKELHFNKNMDALKKMQAGADKLATVVGVTLGPKVRMLPWQAAIAHHVY